MKTEWTFHYGTKGFIFEREVKYKGKLKFLEKGPSLGVPTHLHGKPENMLIYVRIAPDANPRNPSVEQTGSIFITIPLSYEQAKPIAYKVAYSLAHRITFESGEFSIHGGLVICKSIPETHEEEREIGDKPYCIKMHLEEVVDPPKFNSKAFVEMSKSSLDIRLIAQHNMAKSASNPIDKFLNFFKILESQCPPRGKKQTLQDSLEGDKKLFKIFHNTFKFESMDRAWESFSKFIKSIVYSRHRCAHLKENTNFGYVPIDPKIREEVEPFLEALEILTYEMIINTCDEV